MTIAIGAICLLLGAAAAWLYANSQSNAKVIAAKSAVSDAEAEARRINDDARREADSAKKSALIEAREEILQLKQRSEAEEKARKAELQALEGRIMQREEKRKALHALLQGYRPSSEGALIRTRSRFFTFNHGVKVYEATYTCAIAESTRETATIARTTLSVRLKT